MPRTTIYDEILTIEELEDFEKKLEKAWDEHMPLLADRYGLEVLQESKYRITLEVIVDAD